jgi:hypothetical protein
MHSALIALLIIAALLGLALLAYSVIPGTPNDNDYED